MTIRQELLTLLLEKPGEFISGGELAEAYGVSRTAVWKAVKKLQRDGYAITSVPNRGYCLLGGTTALTAEGIAQRLHHPKHWPNIQVYSTLDSTNNEAKRQLASGAAMPLVLLAEEQTGGRGRLGRSFFSPSGSGIYMTVVLKPSATAQQSVLVTTAASVAICHAIATTTGKECDIKWVNDLYLQGKKVCGILTEAVTSFETGTIESLVLGIGINFSAKQEDFPEELQDKAGALYGEDTHGVTRNALVASILNELETLPQLMENSQFLAEYKARSLVLGKEVLLLGGAEETVVLVEDIHQNGGLVVRYSDGTQGLIQTGEVSVRPLPPDRP